MLFFFPLTSSPLKLEHLTPRHGKHLGIVGGSLLASMEPERQVEVGLSASADITVKARFAFDVKRTAF